MAFQGKLVLLLTADAIFLGDPFGSEAHVLILERAPQAIVHTGIQQLTMAQAVSCAPLL
jgi:hypothetical protein